MMKNDLNEKLPLSDAELMDIAGGNPLPGQANFTCQKCGAGYSTDVKICNKFVDGVKCGGSVVFKN